MSYPEALQRTLANEHAAVYVYGALGAQTSRSADPDLYTAVADAYATHRAWRDRLTGLLRELGEDPVAAEPAYELPEDLGTPELVTARALDLERASAAVYAFLVASSPGPRRRFAVELLTQTAVRELAFRGTPEMFPGSDEHADR